MTLGTSGFGGGGNFNYFLPIKLAQDYLDSLKIKVNLKSDVSDSYRQAVDLLSEGKCDRAQAKVAALQQYFHSNFITRMIQTCFEKYQPESQRISLTSSLYLMVGAAMLVGMLFGAGIMFWFTPRRFPKPFLSRPSSPLPPPPPPSPPPPPLV